MLVPRLHRVDRVDLLVGGPARPSRWSGRKCLNIRMMDFSEIHVPQRMNRPDFDPPTLSLYSATRNIDIFGETSRQLLETLARKFSTDIHRAQRDQTDPDISPFSFSFWYRPSFCCCCCLLFVRIRILLTLVTP